VNGRHLPVVATLLAICPAVSAGQDVVFRATTETVTVDVSVEQDGRPIADLTASDFIVTDNGRPQTVTEVTRETLPIDLTCIIDLSGSVDGPLLDALTRAVDAVGRALRPDDRASVVTFNQHIRHVRTMQAGWPADFVLGAPGSLTSLFDAMAVALITPVEVGRRSMAIVFTDGVDTTSFTDGSSLIDIARRSNTAVFTVALADGTRARPREPGHRALFEALATATGGVLDVVQRDEDLSAAFEDALDAFRTSYVLAYTYEGPAEPGWHPIEVTIERPGTFEVRARQGYFSK